MRKDGKDITLNSLSNQFPSTTIQSATDCFRLGRIIIRFPRLCLPSTHSLSSRENSEPTYSSIKSLSSNEDTDAVDELLEYADTIADEGEDNLKCEINLNANKYRMCKAKAVHNAALGRTDASLVSKMLTAMKAAHLDTKPLFANLYDVAEQSNFMSLRSWPKKPKTKFLVLFDHGYVKASNSRQNYPKFENPKVYFNMARSPNDS